ncbi:hypothetical protein pb186bvf_007968 [Paramecium bursaria]
MIQVFVQSNKPFKQFIIFPPLKSIVVYLIIRKRKQQE